MRNTTMVASKAQTATLDSEGRLLIPEATRKELGLSAGDLLYIQSDPESGMVHLAKAINPFDGLALAALAEDNAGLTVTLEEAWELIDQEVE
jgi:bifunctional DNA-binding transcriptional regulator/antitoxin component of YhaV-PrlF toxin-antitoxin module